MANDHDSPKDPFFDENPKHKPEIPEEKAEGEEDAESSEDSPSSKVDDGETLDPLDEQNDATNAASVEHADPTSEEGTAAPESSPAPEEKIEYVQYIGEHEEDAYSSPVYGDVQPNASLDYGYTAALRKLYADPEHLRELAEWEAAQNAPLPMPPDNFPGDPADSTLIAQGDTQTTAEATHPETVHPHTPTTQHDGHGDHHAKPGEPKAAPELDAVGAGNAALTEGHQGEAVGEIQRLLGLEADGIFSADLAAQIAQFQEDEGIQATGVIDQLTLQLLREVEEERLRANQSTPSKTKNNHLSFNLEAEQKQGFPQTQSAPESSSQPPKEQNQGNPIAEAAEIVKQITEGVVIGFGEVNALSPLSPENEKNLEQLRRDVPFVVGEELGKFGGILQGGKEILEGMGLMGLGGAEATITSETIVGAIPGVIAIEAGIALDIHGAAVAGNAMRQISEDAQRIFNPIDGGGGSSTKSDKLSAGAQEAKERGWPDPPESHEWYKRKRGEDEVIEGEEGVEAGESGEESTKDVLDLRRKPGFAEKGFPERQYNPKTREFVLREKTPDFKAKKIGEDIEIDVSTSKLFDEQLKIRGDAMVKRDELMALREELKKEKKVLSEEEELKLKDAIQKVQDSSEAMGEIGINHFMETQYPHYERIEVPNSSGGAKQDRFDSIYKDPGPPPEYIVLEGKGGDGKFTTRKVGEDESLNAQQCTPEYNESIIKEMRLRGEPEANGLRKALKEGRLRTFKSQTPIKNGSAKGQTPTLKVEKLKVSEYDMKDSIKVDKTVKPANPQAPSP